MSSSDASGMIAMLRNVMFTSPHLISIELFMWSHLMKPIRLCEWMLHKFIMFPAADSSRHPSDDKSCYSSIKHGDGDGVEVGRKFHTMITWH